MKKPMIIYSKNKSQQSLCQPPYRRNERLLQPEWNLCAWQTEWTKAVQMVLMGNWAKQISSKAMLQKS